MTSYMTTAFVFQFREERQLLHTALGDILNSNDSLREKHEKELYDLNTKLVETLQQCKSERIDPKANEELSVKVEGLQKEFEEKTKEYNNLKSTFSDEANAIKSANEVRQAMHFDISICKAEPHFFTG